MIQIVFLESEGVKMGLFYQNAAKRKLILVHSDNTEVFANYLQMLISANDDVNGEVVGVEDGSVETAIWSEKEYAAQKPTLSSVDHILFIGRGKTLSKETYGMNTKFEKYGMKYGWLGKRAYLTVDGSPIRKKELQSFIDFAKTYNPDLKDNEVVGIKAQASSVKRKGIKGILKTSAKSLLPFVGPSMVLNDLSNDAVRSCQYKTAIVIFYKEGLAEFLKS